MWLLTYFSFRLRSLWALEINKKNILVWTRTSTKITNWPKDTSWLLGVQVLEAVPLASQPYCHFLLCMSILRHAISVLQVLLLPSHSKALPTCSDPLLLFFPCSFQNPHPSHTRSITPCCILHTHLLPTFILHQWESEVQWFSCNIFNPFQG